MQSCGLTKAEDRVAFSALIKRAKDSERCDAREAAEDKALVEILECVLSLVEFKEAAGVKVATMPDICEPTESNESTELEVHDQCQVTLQATVQSIDDTTGVATVVLESPYQARGRIRIPMCVAAGGLLPSTD